MSRRVTITILCAGAALVAGCGKKAPSGQVAATVNGKDVTLQEINTELQAANVPPAADKQAVQRALLQRIVDRKLLVAAAEDKGLDKTPEFLAQRRRVDELLLAESYAKQQLANIPVPTAGEVDKFMNDRPNVFARREQLVLDQIRFPLPADAKQAASLQAALKDAHDMATVEASLTKLGVRYDKGQAGLDTGAVPPPMMAQINKLPASEPFVVPQAGQVTVNVIRDRRPANLDLAKVRPQATAAWRQDKFGQTLQQQLAALRSSAKITYQPGFSPPEPGAKSGAGAAGATPTP